MNASLYISFIFCIGMGYFVIVNILRHTLQSARTRQRQRKKVLTECLKFLRNHVDVPEFQQNILNISTSFCEPLDNSNQHNLRTFENLAPICTAPLSPTRQSTFEQDFIEVAVRKGIGRNCLNDFLSVFHKHGVGKFPRDARACVGSIRKVDSVQMGRGKYYNFGFIRALKAVLANVSLVGNSIRIQINVDGLPVGKSSSVVFWPILCRAFVDDYVSSVFIVGLYSGNAKPKLVSEFLNPFVDEFKQGCEQGITVGGKCYTLSIHSIVCDALARQYVKIIIGHSGYYSCERCVIRGVHVRNKSKGIRFLEINSAERTDDSFRNREHLLHHVGDSVSPFCDLAMDMVRDFPLDYMHLVLLGVVRRLLKIWLGVSKSKGVRSKQYKLSNSVIKKTLNRRQAKFSSSIPCDFQRRPRSFLLLSIFKASEFRTFLCYTSPIVLKNVFGCDVIFSHFMCLVVSMRILLSRDQSRHDINFARKCIQRFVERFASIYGEHNVVYNVHSLVHITDDYVRFGFLDNISCFPFESYLFKLKNYVKRGGDELEQVVKRILESSNFSSSSAKGGSNSDVDLKGMHCNGPVGCYRENDVSQYSQVLYHGRMYDLTKRNNAVFVDGSYGHILNIIKVDNHVLLVVQLFRDVNDVFSYPCKSSRVGIVLAKSKNDCYFIAHITEVVKCWSVKWSGDKYYFSRLLHANR